jgi:hypothetical protein
MRSLLEELEELHREQLRLDRWRQRNRAECRDVLALRAAAVCDRCRRQSCGPAEYAVVSDVLAMRVGFRCAVEAWLLREEFETAVGRIRIDVVQ